MSNDPKKRSFINRKRPAIKDLVEDVLGPTSHLDEVISNIAPVQSEITPEDELPLNHE